ncbi:putative beta-tubulin cofactor D, partial [Operophtera brumata]
YIIQHFRLHVSKYLLKNVRDEWLSLIEECLSHEVQVVREKAIHALPLVFEQYLRDDGLQYGAVDAKHRRMELVEKYCAQLGSTSVNGLVLRMGHARAVGSLPKFVLTEHLPTVVRSLMECSKVTEATHKWAEARRDAVIGLTEVCATMGVVGGVERYLGDIVQALLECLLSICRQCAVEAPHLNSPEVVRAVLCGVAQQAVEKIDRTRAHAGRIFTSIIYKYALKRIFPSDEVELKPQKEAEEDQPPTSENSNVVLWLFPGHTMPRFVQLLSYDDYRYCVIKGLIVDRNK